MGGFLLTPFVYGKCYVLVIDVMVINKASANSSEDKTHSMLNCVCSLNLARISLNQGLTKLLNRESFFFIFFSPIFNEKKKLTKIKNTPLDPAFVSIYRTSPFPKLRTALSTTRYVVSISTALSGVQGQG